MKKILLVVVAMLAMAGTVYASPVTPGDFDQLSGDMRCQSGSYTVLDNGRMKFCYRDSFCNVRCN